MKRRGGRLSLRRFNKKHDTTDDETAEGILTVVNGDIVRGFHNISDFITGILII